MATKEINYTNPQLSISSGVDNDHWRDFVSYSYGQTYGYSDGNMKAVRFSTHGGQVKKIHLTCLKISYPSKIYVSDRLANPSLIAGSALASYSVTDPDITIDLQGFSTSSKNIYLIFDNTTAGSGSYKSYGLQIGDLSATLDVDDTVPVVTLVGPINGAIRDGGQAITFSFIDSAPADYDTYPNGQYSFDGNTWYTFPYTWYNGNNATAPEKYFGKGNKPIYWRVRTCTDYSDYGEYTQSDFSLEYYAPSVSNLSPQNTSFYASNDSYFSWKTTSGSTTTTRKQMEYSSDNGTTWLSLVDAAAVTLPVRVRGRTFQPGLILWRVRAQDEYGGWCDWQVASVTVLEDLPSVSNITPYGRYKDREKPITISWDSHNSYGTITGSELQYSIGNGENWVDLGSVDGTGTSYTVPANTFPAIAYSDAASRTGGIRLRIRSKNGDQKYGSWYYGSFATVDAPISAVPTAPRYGAAADETTAITFSFNTENPINTPPSDVDIRWKVSDGEWQYLEHLAESMTPGTGGGNPLSNTVVVPANTFPASVIYYQVRAYNQDGVAGDWSSEAYFSTIDAPSVSTPISPSGTIEDTDSDLVFRWSTSSTSGSTPTGADLQYSYDGITWLVLGHTDGTTQLTVSGGRIHAGTVQWQVRSYNRNGTPGAWSGSATFVAHAAPRILDLITDDKPFTTFTWQATDQRDYHIVIDDDLVIGPVFDEVKTYQLTDYLEDGLHTVKIRVQNEMSVWSEWAETQFQVLNIPDGEIELQGSWDIDADLFWEDQATDAEYMVYRDGGLIGKTHSKAFADRVVLGEHRYHVIRRLSDGCYSISNTVSGSMSTRLTRVAPLVGGEWLALVKSENAKRSERFTRRRKVAYHHFSGNKFPTPEIGDQEELIGEYDAAWMHTEEGAEILDSLVGQAIIVKSRSGKVIIGVLEGYTSGDKKHFSGFTFDLKQMDWEDYVCDI